MPHNPAEPTPSPNLELDLGLADTTFVVFDLETTGTSAGDSQIIEIGAVKVRGGETIDTFHTLLDPGTTLPSFISQLTGIRSEDLVGKPQLGTVIPQFLKFAAGAVWVAHNARFDVGFIRAACTQLGLAWPAPQVVDTLQLARRTLPREAVGSFRLGALAKYVGADTRPNHRALDDALATVDLLHFLIEKLGDYEVDTLETLTNFRFTTNAPRGSRVAKEISQKRTLIADVTHSPGVYIFRSAANDPLYIGTAIDLRRRLLSYFNGTDKRRRISEMVLLTERVETIECAHGLAAEVQEARLLAHSRPPYNRQRKEPTRGWFLVKDTATNGMRLARKPTSTTSIGPFKNRTLADLAADQLGFRDALYDDVANELISGGSATIAASVERIGELAAAGRYRRAAQLRDDTAAIIRTVDRFQRLRSLALLPEMQVAFPDGAGGWHLSIIRYGKLAASATCPRGGNVAHVARLLAQSAETVFPMPSPYGAASHIEVGVIYRWLMRDDVRIGPTVGTWASGINSLATWRPWVEKAGEANASERTQRFLSTTPKQ